MTSIFDQVDEETLAALREILSEKEAAKEAAGEATKEAAHRPSKQYLTMAEVAAILKARR